MLHMPRTISGSVLVLSGTLAPRAVSVAAGYTLKLGLRTFHA